MQVDRLRGHELRAEYNKLSQKAIWDARTWLYQKQLIDDFVLFTMVNNLCIDNNVEIAFNLRRTFKKFVLEQSRPHAIQAAAVIEEDKENENENEQKRDSPLTIEKQYENLRLLRL